MTDIADLRREYASRALDEQGADADPIAQFGVWFSEALKAEPIDTNAMTLATVSASGEPSARTVLVKGFDEAGFVFFTNYDSDKGRDLAANARASLLFYWRELERQVRINGAVTRTSTEESDAYFESRPFESRIGAIVSPQSRPVPSRGDLEARYTEALAQHPDGRVPRPASWGGYRVQPDRIEFWQGRASRLHDRLLYVKQADGSWARSRLAP
ncbi:MAG: pyridoxamine 5'-phosphate oxidase [Acidimicrobiia bacterium]|nr:pyridoxamine 5'-phosphate oxidase [Acidimicrobiia bacterium]